MLPNWKKDFEALTEPPLLVCSIASLDDLRALTYRDIVNSGMHIFPLPSCLQHKIKQNNGEDKKCSIFQKYASISEKLSSSRP